MILTQFDSSPRHHNLPTTEPKLFIYPSSYQRILYTPSGCDVTTLVKCSALLYTKCCLLIRRTRLDACMQADALRRAYPINTRHRIKPTEQCNDITTIKNLSGGGGKRNPTRKCKYILCGKLFSLRDEPIIPPP